jgi:hypothetical protein
MTVPVLSEGGALDIPHERKQRAWFNFPTYTEWEYNIKKSYKIDYKYIDQIQLAHDKVQWQAVLETVMKLRQP